MSNNIMRFLRAETASLLPSDASLGEVAYCADTGDLYAHDGYKWQCISISSNMSDWTLSEVPEPMSLFRSSYLLKQSKDGRNQERER